MGDDMYLLAFILQAILMIAFWCWVIGKIVDSKLKKLNINKVDKQNNEIPKVTEWIEGKKLD